MNDSILLVPHGDVVYAVPVEAARKYVLVNEQLQSAQAAIVEQEKEKFRLITEILNEGDVVGQSDVDSVFYEFYDRTYGTNYTNKPTLESGWNYRKNSRGEAYVLKDGKWVRERAYD